MDNRISIKADQLVGFTDLQFARINVQDYSSRGLPFQRNVPVGMPHIPPKVLNSVFYLYDSVDDAKEGSNFGGTGFVVAVPSSMHAKYGRGFIYGVTNWHVACRGSSVVRLNTKSGPPDIIPLGPDQWEFDPKYDVAVVPLNINDEFHRVALLDISTLITRDSVKEMQIGPGDNVFMVGRFVDHDGKKENVPAVRFGNISVNPTPIEQPNGRVADSWCIDMHSRSGYSGSPVFVYRTPGSELGHAMGATNKDVLLSERNAHLFGVLGIHFAQFPEIWEVGPSGKLIAQGNREPLLTDGRYIQGLSGMTCVLPAWNIWEVLNMPKLRDHRKKMEELAEAQFKRDGYPPLAENAGNLAQPANDANPNHREDFTSLANAAAQKLKPAE